MAAAPGQRDHGLPPAPPRARRSHAAAWTGAVCQPAHHGDPRRAAHPPRHGSVHSGGEPQLARGIAAGACVAAPAPRRPPAAFPGRLEFPPDSRRRAHLCAGAGRDGDTQAGAATLPQCAEATLREFPTDTGARQGTSHRRTRRRHLSRRPGQSLSPQIDARTARRRAPLARDGHPSGADGHPFSACGRQSSAPGASDHGVAYRRTTAAARTSSGAGVNGSSHRVARRRHDGDRTALGQDMDSPKEATP
jgi:hypothetical protein